MQRCKTLSCTKAVMHRPADLSGLSHTRASSPRSNSSEAYSSNQQFPASMPLRLTTDLVLLPRSASQPSRALFFGEQPRFCIEEHSTPTITSLFYYMLQCKDPCIRGEVWPTNQTQPDQPRLGYHSLILLEVYAAAALRGPFPRPAQVTDSLHCWAPFPII